MAAALARLRDSISWLRPPQSAGYAAVPLLPVGQQAGETDIQPRRPRRVRLCYCLPIAVLLLLFLYGAALVTKAPFSGTSVDCPARLSMAKMGVNLPGEPSLPPRLPARDRSPNLPRARQVSPRELLDNYAEHGPMSPIPKIIHQSWKSTTLPKRVEPWVDSIRLDYPDWQWVLWTDEDNEELVRKVFPDLLDLYHMLPKDINRVDFAR
jgi:hypothetical protein